MTSQDWGQLTDLIERAIRGDEQAISDVCEFIETHMKQEILNRLLRAGVGSSLGEAWQEVLLTVLRKLPQLKVVDAFEPWLWRLEMSVAKKYRPRNAWLPRSVRVEPKVCEQPREIGTRRIVVAGNPQIARIFESPGPQEQPTPRRPLFKPLSEEIIAKASMANRLNYPRRIDVRRALAKLPKRWARVIYLIYFGGYSRTEAAKIMGCSRSRIFKLTQKAKNRLRGLLAGYSRNGRAKPEARSHKANSRTRTKRALPVADISLGARPIRVSAHVRVGLRHQ